LTMNNMVLPKIERDAMSRNYGRFVISPMEQGFGITIGNMLRRVLLSALPGAAVTSIRVSGVPHEFSAIPDVREDMTQLVLQIKQLRAVLHGADNARLRLEVHGEGTVTAADVLCPPEVTIINPELYLFTVDSENASFEMELVVQAGRGYEPAENRSRLPIGELPIDAIFSPVRRASFRIEGARVGQHTNYDKLVLEIWTDGTIRPEEAMSQAAQIVMNHLRILAGVDYEMFEQPPPEPEPEAGIPTEIYETPIEQLDLSVRVFNSLKRTGITNVGEVLEMLDKGSDAMLAIRNFGEKSLDELTDRLREKGFMPEDAAFVSLTEEE